MILYLLGLSILSVFVAVAAVAAMRDFREQERRTPPFRPAAPAAHRAPAIPEAAPGDVPPEVVQPSPQEVAPPSPALAVPAAPAPVVPSAAEIPPPVAEPAPSAPPAPEPPAPVAPAAEPITLEPEPTPEGIFDRLRRGVSKTRELMVRRLDRIFGAASAIDDDLLEEIEEVLVTSDVGVKTTERLLDELRKAADDGSRPEDLRDLLKDRIKAILTRVDKPAREAAEKPRVVLVVGVNGTGKTTSIGKLALERVRAGEKVMLAAGDTFRAAAIEQLEVWGERVGATVIRQQPGSDPSAVAFDAVKAAKARGVDTLLVDTAGRLHTKKNLMDEIRKVKRVIGKEHEGAPHETLLVLDATTGQNAINQAQLFHEALELDGIVLTKLDGTAKGGVIIGISDTLEVPVRYIGIGESAVDLRPFDPEKFVDALFER